MKFFIYLFTKKHRTLSVPAQNGNHPSHRVSTLVASRNFELSTSPFKSVTTMFELSKRSFNTYGNKTCMSSRTYLGQKSAKVKEFSTETKDLTYSQVGDMANRFGAALKSVGMVSAPPTTTLKQLASPCSFAIFENTCPEWMVASQGCFTQGLIVTTIYATLGMDAVVDAVEETGTTAMLCNKINVGKLMDRIATGSMKSLKTIIYTDDMVAPDDATKVPRSGKGGKGGKGVKVIDFAEFIRSGDTTKFPPTPPTPETCAVIMYTSGSTGKPKGVVVKHSNLLACAAASKDGLGLVESDVYLGYLPLAHILELMAEVSGEAKRSEASHIYC